MDLDIAVNKGELTLNEKRAAERYFNGKIRALCFTSAIAGQSCRSKCSIFEADAEKENGDVLGNPL